MGHARKIEDLMETAGRTAAGSAQALRDAQEFTGRVAAAALSGIVRPRSFRLPDFGAVFLRTGAEAVPVTLLVGFLLGFIIAYMSAAMLNKFGAEIYVANLIGLALIRELGTIVAAIVIAARSASAFAETVRAISKAIDACAAMATRAAGEEVKEDDGCHGADSENRGHP